MRIRRRTREQYRHERATVLQHLGSPSADAVRQDIAANKARAAELRRGAQEGGGRDAEVLGLVIASDEQGLGPARSPKTCVYCGQTLPSHYADCPVIS